MKKYEVRCPITAYLSIMDGHWKTIIIWQLNDRSLRFNELLKAIPDISTKVLTEQVKELEFDNILVRKAFSKIPPRVEYSLTKYGESLLPVLVELRQWGLRHLK